jgi:type III secretory pathway component EscT
LEFAAVDHVNSYLAALTSALAHEGVDLPALGLAWARVAPAVAIVPAFGLRAMPAPGRALLALAMAAAIAPAVGTSSGLAEDHGAWPTLATFALRAVVEAARGLPVAIAAAVPLWAATMAGGVADALRGAQDAPGLPVVEGRATPIGVALSLLASAIFLATGGPARVASALMGLPFVSPQAQAPALVAVDDLVRGTTVAVALGAPLLAAAVIIEVAGALVARAASPAQIHAVLAPARALGVLAVLALVFDRLEAALAAYVRGG